MTIDNTINYAVDLIQSQIDNLTNENTNLQNTICANKKLIENWEKQKYEWE